MKTNIGSEQNDHLCIHYTLITHLLHIFFLNGLFVGRTGLTWDISTTICPHQMAAVGFEHMTLGFLRLGPYSLRHQVGRFMSWRRYN